MMTQIIIKNLDPLFQVNDFHIPKYYYWGRIYDLDVFTLIYFDLFLNGTMVILPQGVARGVGCYYMCAYVRACYVDASEVR